MQWIKCGLDRVRHQLRKRRWGRTQVTGRRGEDLAHRHLLKAGYRVVARNFRTRSGMAEVDLIAWDADTLVFVEVKALSSDRFGSPDRAVDPEKEEHLRNAAWEYRRRHELQDSQYRFDIVTVVSENTPNVQIMRDAIRRS